MENKERLLSFVERIERLEEEKKELTADISEVLKEAKGEGFDTKVIKEIIKLRRSDKTFIYGDFVVFCECLNFVFLVFSIL